MDQGKKILVGVDGSEHSKMALLEAITLAKKIPGFIKAVTVYRQGMDKEAERILKEVKHYLTTERINHEVSSILGSNPSRALVTIAEHEEFYLIVVGSRGLSSTASFLLGSVSRQVVTKANCDVLVVKK